MPLDDVLEYTEERAAILEYEAGLSRVEAEKEAMLSAIMRFDLCGTHQESVLACLYGSA